MRKNLQNFQTTKARQRSGKNQEKIPLNKQKFRDKKMHKLE